MARRRLFNWLRQLFLVSPTAGLNGIQSLILVSSVGYLGYVWHVEQRCPLFPSTRRQRLQQEQQLAETRALSTDPLEAELIKELGRTTFKEWQARGFIPTKTSGPSSFAPLDVESDQQEKKNAVSSLHSQQQPQAQQQQQQVEQHPQKARAEHANSTTCGSESH